MTPRAKKLWEKIRQQNIGELVDKVEFWGRAVQAGADPIEAMSGHLCGPHCMHWETMSEERRAHLRKAPWNRSST